MAELFKKKDFESNNGMLTSIWGPSMWHFLHTISFNYPVKPTKEDRINYYNYLMSLQKILPCSFCRENFKSNLKSSKFSKSYSLKNRTTFSKSIYNLHEEVNKMLGKTSDLTYKQVKNRYEHFRSRCLNDKKAVKKLVKKNKKAKEDGCIDPLYGKKSKCVLNIVPKNSRVKSFKMSPKCKIKRLCKGDWV